MPCIPNFGVGRSESELFNEVSCQCMTLTLAALYPIPSEQPRHGRGLSVIEGEFRKKKECRPAPPVCLDLQGYINKNADLRKSAFSVVLLF